MDYIYKAIIDRFNSQVATDLYTKAGLKPIAHIDRFKGQYLNPELHQPWPLPAVFLKFNVQWSDMLDLKQHGEGIMEVHLELENYHESYDNSPDKDVALLDYEYQNFIFVLLHNFSTDQFMPFSRISSDDDDNPTNTNVAIIKFRFGIEDFSAYRYKDANVQKLDDMILSRNDNPAGPVIPDPGYVI